MDPAHIRNFSIIAHIDHGKTSLVKAITGMDPDRLPEEQSRGITILPGYAHTRLPDGPLLSFVDVPGHERFVKNMVTGVSSVSCTRTDRVSGPA